MNTIHNNDIASYAAGGCVDWTNCANSGDEISNLIVKQERKFPK
jgi:hypothetical protein